MLFNGLWGGTDDHERNHPAFWDGRTFTLALRHLPQPLAGNELSQAMHHRQRWPPVAICSMITVAP